MLTAFDRGSWADGIMELPVLRKIFYQHILDFVQFKLLGWKGLTNCLEIYVLEEWMALDIINILSTDSLLWHSLEELSDQIFSFFWDIGRNCERALLDEFKSIILSFSFERHFANKELEDDDTESP